MTEDQQVSQGNHGREHVELIAKCVVVLASRSTLAQTFVDSLPRESLAAVIWEDPGWLAKVRLWRRRIRRHGLLVTGSRFVALAADHIAFRYHDKGDPEVDFPPPVQGVTAKSVNEPFVIEKIKTLDPTLVVVVGTTLLRTPLLNSLAGAEVVNVHVGRTPAYRGVHGGAWAVLDGRPDDLVTTLHRVDAGVDSGQPIVYLPVGIQPTMTGLARSQLAAGLNWLAEMIRKGGESLAPPDDVPTSQPLRNVPTFNEWIRFRATARRNPDWTGK